MIIGLWINLIFFSDISCLTLNFVIFVEATTFASPQFDIPCCGLDSPLIFISETPTLNNEIVSSKIMIMPIENNFGYV
jgi:hypothetical protein